MSYLSLNEILSAHDKSVGWRAGLLLGLLGCMWLTFAITQLLPGGVLAVWGIVPRTSAGIGGILAAPFLHSDLDHIAANTLSLMTLGSLILLRGLREFVWVTQIGVLVGGFGTWILGTPNSHHIGASGIVFAFCGFLLFRSVFDRTWPSVIVALIVAVAYGASIGYSLVPEEGISWSGHFFGFFGGVVAARHIYRQKQAAKREASAVIESLGLRITK